MCVLSFSHKGYFNSGQVETQVEFEDDSTIHLIASVT